MVQLADHRMSRMELSEEEEREARRRGEEEEKKRKECIMDRRCQVTSDGNERKWNGFRCKGCRIYPIVGELYNCNECGLGDYDLCQRCKDKGVHDHHEMIRIELSEEEEREACRRGERRADLLKNATGDGDEREWYGTKCNVCKKSPIVGKYLYDCDVCDDFYYCQKCNNGWVHCHAMTRL